MHAARLFISTKIYLQYKNIPQTELICSMLLSLWVCKLQLMTCSWTLVVLPFKENTGQKLVPTQIFHFPSLHAMLIGMDN